MGFLGLSLLFVGIVLVINGVNILFKVDAKSSAVMNAITGGVLVIGNFFMLYKAADTADYLNAASGFLFGFTYVFIALNHLLKLDPRPFGMFCGFVAVYAVIMGCISFAAGGFTGYFMGALWIAWAVLWLEGFLEIVCKLKIGKIFPYLSIAEGIFAAFIPALLMLLQIV